MTPSVFFRSCTRRTPSCNAPPGKDFSKLLDAEHTWLANEEVFTELETLANDAAFSRRSEAMAWLFASAHPGVLSMALEVAERNPFKPEGRGRVRVPRAFDRHPIHPAAQGVRMA